MHWTWKSWAHLTLAELYSILQLRQAVFVVEQNCPYLDADGEDEQCWHLLGHKDDALVAYVRVFPPRSTKKDIVIGRVITAQSIRGQGWGRPLMETAESFASHQFGPHSFYLGAQAHLAHFYGSLGYKTCGPAYDEDGIPHLPMRK